MKKRKPWMTEILLQIMEQRRLNKQKTLEYNILHKLVGCKIRRTKETWLNEKCEEIEEMQQRHDSFNMHKMIKEITARQRLQTPGALKNAARNMLPDTKEKLT